MAPRMGAIFRQKSFGKALVHNLCRARKHFYEGWSPLRCERRVTSVGEFSSRVKRNGLVSRALHEGKKHAMRYTNETGVVLVRLRLQNS
jgi:hypothetical protein